MLSPSKIKDYYDAGIWNEQMVRNVHAKGAITDEELADILGIDQC